MTADDERRQVERRQVERRQVERRQVERRQVERRQVEGLRGEGPRVESGREPVPMAMPEPDDDPGETVLAFIEIPRGSRNKYEWDDHLRMFRLDRVLYSSVHYPTDYGFIPDTLAEDGDHLDILVLVQEPTFPGCVIEARPLGGLDMADEKGVDFKVLAVPVGDPRFAHVHSLDAVGDHWLREIETFFATYKLLEPKQTEVLGWHDLAHARTIIERCRERYVAGH